MKLQQAINAAKTYKQNSDAAKKAAVVEKAQKDTSTAAGKAKNSTSTGFTSLADRQKAQNTAIAQKLAEAPQRKIEAQAVVSQREKENAAQKAKAAEMVKQLMPSERQKQVSPLVQHTERSYAPTNEAGIKADQRNMNFSPAAQQRQMVSDSIARTAGADESVINKIAEEAPYKESAFREAADKGLMQYKDSYLQTANFLTGGKIPVLQKVADQSTNELVEKQKQINEINERQQAGKAGEVITNFTSTAVSQIPDLILAFLTAGASTAAKGATLAAGGVSKAKAIGNALKTGVKTAVKNPQFWNSFLRSGGYEYKDAIESGATNGEAMASALLSSLINASIDVSGGIEKIPTNMQGKTGWRSVLEYLKTIGEEGTEEAVQNILSSLSQAAVFDQDRKLFSDTAGENAIVNIPETTEEALYGGGVAALFGAPSAALNAMADINRRAANAQTDVADAPIENGTPKAPALESALADFEAQEMQRTPELIAPSAKVNEPKLNIPEGVIPPANTPDTISNLAQIDAQKRFKNVFPTETENLTPEVQNAPTAVISGAEGQNRTNVLPQEQVVPQTKPVLTKEQKMLNQLKVNKGGAQTEAGGAQTDGNFGKNTVGAAEKNIGTIDDLINQYGAQEPKPNPFYPENAAVQFPKKVSEKEAVSQFVQSIAASEFGTKDIIESIEKHLPKYTHDIKTDEGSLQKAVNDIKQYGFQHSMDNWQSKIDNNTFMTKEDVANAFVLAKVAQDSHTELGNTVKAKILTDLAAVGTKYGQGLQAFGMINQYLGADGITMDVNSEQYANMLVDKIKNTNADRLKGRDIKIDEKILTEAKAALGTENEGKAWDKVYRNIANQLPSTFWEKINSWRYFCMLCNPKTHIRNIVSNMAMQGVVTVKDTVKGVAEAVYNKTQSPDMQSHTTSVLPADEATRKYCKDYWNTFKETVDTPSKYNEQGWLAEHKTNTFYNFGDTETGKKIAKRMSEKLDTGTTVGEAVSKLFEQGFFNSASEFNSWMLNDVEDGGAKKKLFTQAMSRYMKANGWTVDYIQSDAGADSRSEAAAYAYTEALKGTFNQQNQFASWLSSIAKEKPTDKLAISVIKKLVGIEMPFKKVPANLVSTAVEYSPMNAVNGVYQLMSSVKKGKVTADTALNNISAGLTGTGIMGLGAFLAAQGLLSLRDKDEKDKEKAFNKMNGEQEYALTLPDSSSYSLDWLQPAAILLFAGANLWNDKNNNEDANALDLALSTISAMYDPLTNMSMLQNIKDIFLGNQQKDVWGLATDIAGDFATQFIPQVLASLASTMDDKQRNQYYKDKTNGIDDNLEVIANRIKFKVPGLRETLPETVDLWGNTAKNGNGNAGVRALESFVSPGYYKKDTTTKVDEAIKYLYSQTGETSVLPSKIDNSVTVNGITKNLSSSEYVKAQKEKGQTAYKMIEQLISDPTYKSATASEKVKMISDAYSYATAKGKEAVSNYKPTDAWMTKMDEAVKDKTVKNAGQYLSEHSYYKNLSADKEGEEVIKSTSEKYLEHLINQKSTTDEQDLKLYSLITGKDTTGYDNLTTADAKEKIMLAQLIADPKNKAEDIPAYAEKGGISNLDALARYNVANNEKKNIDAFSEPQTASLQKLIEKGWTEEDAVKAANAVISVGSGKEYGFSGSNYSNAVKMLESVGFDTAKAKEFAGIYSTTKSGSSGSSGGGSGVNYSGLNMDANSQKMMSQLIYDKSNNKAQDVQTYAKENGVPITDTLAKYNVATGSKTWKSLSDKQEAAANNIMGVFGWTKDEVVRAASAVTGCNSSTYGLGRGGYSNAVSMLKAVGYTDDKINEFLKYYPT